MNFIHRPNHLNHHNQTGKKIKNYIYNYNELIGRGNFAKVYRGFNTNNQQIVAIKMVSLDQLKSKRLEQLIFEEIKILQQMNHQNVLKFYEALLSDRNCYIVTQLCNEGNLQERIKKNMFFSQYELGKIILDIYQGLKYLRQMGVTHRDLKTANIFLHNGVSIIADFGLAKLYKQKFKDLDIGSPLYMSPEGLIYNVYGEKTDIWSLGIIIYELLHGETPFCHCVSEADLKNAICKPIPEHKFRKDINPLLRQLMNSLLQINDSKRPNVFELMNEPYLKNMLNTPIIKTINPNNMNPNDHTSARKKSMIDVQLKNNPKIQKMNQSTSQQLPEDKLNEGIKVKMINPKMQQYSSKKAYQFQETKPIKINGVNYVEIRNVEQDNMVINNFQRVNQSQRSQNNAQNQSGKGNHQMVYLNVKPTTSAVYSQMMFNRPATHRQANELNKITSIGMLAPNQVIFHQVPSQIQLHMRRQHSDKTIETKESNEQKHLLQNGKLQRPRSVYFNI